jgi:hypothetical protein
MSSKDMIFINTFDLVTILTEFTFDEIVGGGLMSYLRYLCLFVYSGIQTLLYCVFVLFFFVL